MNRTRVHPQKTSALSRDHMNKMPFIFNPLNTRRNSIWAGVSAVIATPHRDLPASASPVLRSKVCSTTPDRRRQSFKGHFIVASLLCVFLKSYYCLCMGLQTTLPAPLGSFCSSWLSSGINHNQTQLPFESPDKNKTYTHTDRFISLELAC